MKSRSLGLVFVAAVMVPSILLAVLSIRAAGREVAWVERQLATTLDVETTHAAALANAEVQRIIAELRAGLDLPAGSAYAAVLRRWKAANPLVEVPFLVSPRYGVLWPTGASGATQAEKAFLKDQGPFLSDRIATAVLQNIADRYQQEILARAEQEKTAPAVSASVAAGAASPSSAGTRSVSATAAEAPTPAAASAPAEASAPAAASTPAAAAVPASALASLPPAEPAARQKALDAFAQSPAIQSDVYAAAAEKGDTLSQRVAQPVANAAAAPTAQQAEAQQPAEGTGPASQKPQPSEYVVTSQLLSQIASAGDAGIIPRFTAAGLVFLFWERQADGRIAGCQIAGSILRARIVGVLGTTATASRILTFLDENGSPLAAPPNEEGRDWSRPFVSREIGPSLPRWEAAAYLTRPDAIAAQARSSSLVLWILVAILVVSVAGGGSMVLSSVVGEMRLAQNKATFVTNVSHELKTPLTSISLFIDLLRRPRPLAAEKRQSYLALMASETERLTRLINNVLDFSSMSARGRRPGAKGGTPGQGNGAPPREGKRYAMQELDAAALVREVLDGQRVRMESIGFAVKQTGADSGCTVRADPEALKQVLLNLLSNAEKYSRDTREIEVRSERVGQEVHIRVLDRGIGVPERERERIFREFYRIDDSLASGVQGTGLGLTIARRIARDHGGDITCAGRPGGGSDFMVRLPAVGREKA